MVFDKKCIFIIPILRLQKYITNSFCVRNISNRAVAGLKYTCLGGWGGVGGFGWDGSHTDYKTNLCTHLD